MGKIKRMVTCYGCDKRFSTYKPKELSVGDTKAWCNECFLYLKQFRDWCEENEK